MFHSGSVGTIGHLLCWGTSQCPFFITIPDSNPDSDNLNLNTLNEIFQGASFKFSKWFQLQLKLILVKTRKHRTIKYFQTLIFFLKLSVPVVGVRLGGPSGRYRIVVPITGLGQKPLQHTYNTEYIIICPHIHHSSPV